MMHSHYLMSQNVHDLFCFKTRGKTTPTVSVRIILPCSFKIHAFRFSFHYGFGVSDLRFEENFDFCFLFHNSPLEVIKKPASPPCYFGQSVLPKSAANTAKSLPSTSPSSSKSPSQGSPVSQSVRPKSAANTARSLPSTSPS